MVMIMVIIMAIVIGFVVVIRLLGLNPIQIMEAFEFQLTFLPISRFIVVVVFMETLSVYQDFILTILVGKVALWK